MIHRFGFPPPVIDHLQPTDLIFLHRFLPVGGIFIQFVPNIADEISKSAPWAIYGIFLIGFIFIMIQVLGYLIVIRTVINPILLTSENVYGFQLSLLREVFCVVASCVRTAVSSAFPSRSVPWRSS